MSTFDAGRLVRFGAFELDLDEGVLCRYGRRVPLQEQPARILTLLVSRPDEVVTREELRHLVWTDDTFVEFDASLNAAITKIRRALRDSASAPRFIETVPKRGYRFLADVQGLQPGSESTGVATRAVVAAPSAPSDIEARQAPPDVRRAHKTALLAIVAATLLSAWLLSPGLVRISRAARAVAHGAALRDASRGDAYESGKRAGGGNRQATRSPANTHRQTVAAWRHCRSARTQSRARSGRTTERGRHANRAAACDRAAYCVHRRRARALGRCRRCARQRSDVAGIADRPAGRHGARRSDERERARGACPPHDGEPRGVSVVPAGTVALRTADEPRSARRARGVRAGHGQRLELRARLRVAREHLHAAQLPRLCPAVGDGTGATRGWRKGAPARRRSGRGAPQSCVGHGLSRAALGRRRGGVSPRTRARSQLRHRSPLVCVLPHDRRTIRRGAGRATTCARNRSADADAERGARGPAHRHAPARSCS